MSFSNLISKVLDFVNLGKVVVDAGPGIVLAVALGVIAATVAELPILPFVNGTAAEQGEVRGRYAQQLENLRKRWLEEQQRLTSLAREKAEADAFAEQAAAEVDRLTEELQSLRQTQRQRLEGDRVATARVAARIADLEDDLARASGESKAGRAGQSAAERRLADQQARVEELRADYETLKGRRITDLRGLFGYLLDHLIGFGLVGWVLGTLLSPLNRALLIGFLGKQIKSAAESTVTCLVDRREAQGQRQLSAAEHAEIRKLLGAHGASYFIGRGIVGRSEWDELVADYYRWAELSTNLVIPLFALGGAIGWIAGGQRLSGWESFWYSFWVTACLVGALLCWLRGRRTYIEYITRRNEFLLGRLEKVFDARKALVADLDQGLAKAAESLKKLRDGLEGLLTRLPRGGEGGRAG